MIGGDDINVYNYVPLKICSHDERFCNYMPLKNVVHTILYKYGLTHVQFTSE
jgi:hypothetical protein